MEDGIDSGMAEGPTSPMLVPTPKNSDIRSGIEQHKGTAKESNAVSNSMSNEALSSLVNIIQNLTQQQNDNARNNSELLAKFLTKDVSSRPRLSEVYIASFDPDGDVPIRDWCDHVDRAKDHWNLTDYEICNKIASCLQGRAKALGDIWLVKSPLWVDMKEALIQTFEPEARYSNDIVKFRNFKLDMTKPADSITKAWNFWKRIMQGNKDSDAVEAVIGCIDSDSLRLRLLSSKCSTVPELISVVSTIRMNNNKADEPLAKRSRYRFARNDGSNRDVTCFKCGRAGHVQSKCTTDKVLEPRSLLTDLPNNYTKDNTKIVCGFCRKLGHYEANCFLKNNDKIKNISIAQRQSLICTPLKITINNKNYVALFDSGADSSLVQRSLSMSLPGKRNYSTLFLQGLGIGVPIASYQYITVLCEISTIFVEINFHVVEDHEIPCELLVGSDLVKIPGLNVNINNHGATISRMSSIMSIISHKDLVDNLDTDLVNENDITALKCLLNKYNDLFATGIPKTTVTTGCLEIKLRDPLKVVCRRPYRMAPVERDKIRHIIGDLIASGIVRESTSEFASPVILVKKKNGDDRMCVDYRELNSNTVPIKFPLPIISDQIDRLANAKYFICLDMAQGFHQIPIKADSIHKTAFITPDGLYEYVMMPFGLMNAPAVYQRSIMTALRPYLNEILIYMDDILIKCSNFNEGILLLDRVLSTLRDTGFSVNPNKCTFFKRSVEYLGNVISNGTAKPSPKKVEALEKSPIPNNVKQVRQFCGLASYFRRFIPSFSERMIPLYNLTKKDVKFIWTAECENARLDVIRRLTSAPALIIYREDLPIELHTDASSTGLGAVLIQRKEGRQHVVAFMSMRTTKPESNYHSYELETLAIVRAVKHFRQYLYGRHFTIVTDCNAIKSSLQKHELLPRIHRWLQYLQHYDFKIEYRQGTRMRHADYFSRNPVACINSLNNTDSWLKVEQRRDPDLHAIIKKIEKGDNIDNYRLYNLVLQRKHVDDEPGNNVWKKVVPKSYQWSIINAYHTSLKHFGWDKTLSKLREEYWFPEMTNTVRKFVENCVICKTSKGASGQKQVQMHPIPKEPIPFHTIHMDMTGRLTNRNNKHEYVIVTIDAFTKYIMLDYATDKTTKSLIHALKRVVSLFGAPKQIISDQDTAFRSDFEIYCKEQGIVQHFIAPGVSRANGQVERMMTVVKNGLTIIRNYEHNNWKTGLDALQLAINCTKHKTTGISPLKALTGRQCAVPIELLSLVDENNSTVDRKLLDDYMGKRIEKISNADKLRFDSGKAKVKRFNKGDMVLFKTNPRTQIGLDLKYPDAYEIYKVLPHDRYKVKKVVGRGRPKKVAHDQLRLAPKPGTGTDQDVVSAVPNDLADSTMHCDVGNDSMNCP